MLLTFDEWTPDRAALNTGMVRTVNLLPTVEGYETAPSFIDSTIPPIPARPMTIQAFRCSDGNIFTFAFCKERIYLLLSGSWTDVTRAAGGTYATPDNGYWWVNQWADLIYCGNGKVIMQKFDMNGSTKFVDVPGSPVAKIGVIIRDFQVLFDTNEASGTVPNPFRMHWSGRLRPETFAPSLVTQAGFRDVPDIGLLVQAVGGDYGLIAGQTGMSRIDYIGPPVQFQLSRVDEDVGCLYRNTMLKIAGTTYFFSNRGWRMSNGGSSMGIGFGKVDAYTRNRINSQQASRMSFFLFPNRPVFGISYVSQDSKDEFPDELIYYNYDVQRFSEGRARLISLGTLGMPPLFVDDAILGEKSVDDATFGEVSVDMSDDLKLQIVAVQPSDNSVLMLDESQVYAELETREIQFIPSMRAQVTRTRLIGEGLSNAYTVRVSARDRLIDTGIIQDRRNKPEHTGSVAQNRRGRYHRMSVRLEARYKSLIGLEVDFSPAGRI